MCRQLYIFFVFIIISVETVWYLISNFIVINENFNRIIEIFISKIFVFWRYKSFHLSILFYFYYFCQIILYCELNFTHFSLLFFFVYCFKYIPFASKNPCLKENFRKIDFFTFSTYYLTDKLYIFKKVFIKNWLVKMF